MKKIVSISAVVFSLMLVGAGCGAASTPTGAGSANSAAAGSTGVSSAFTAAGIKFTAKDKTAAAQQVLGADAGLVSSFTEYKFEGSNLIVLVGEVKDPNDAPMVGDKLSDAMKAQASAAGLEYSSIGGLNDKHWFGYVLEKDGDYDAKIKALGAISQ